MPQLMQCRQRKMTGITFNASRNHLLNLSLASEENENVPWSFQLVEVQSLVHRQLQVGLLRCLQQVTLP